MDKEKIVRDLVDTFKDRNELHAAYKEKMKVMIGQVIVEFLTVFIEKEDVDLTPLKIEEWVDNFVETRFKPQE